MIGNWISSGRHPLIGLMPASLYNFICSCDSRSLSLPYFFCNFAISGWNSCILRADFCCPSVSGRMSRRIKMVSIAMATTVWCPRKL